MANNKKPSIYSDRSDIGSVNELDEYGVWVKSEPQVLSADSADALKSGDLDDSAEFVSEEVPAGDSLSFDDAVLDVKGASKDASSAFTDMEFPDDNIDIGADDDSLSLDTNLDDLNIPNTDIPSGQDDNFEIEDTNFDDFETPPDDSESKTDFPADDFEVKSDLNLDDFSDFSEPEQSGGQDTGADDFETDDFAVPTVKAIENNVESIQEDINAVSKIKEGELSTQLLLKIANELSSIRGELSELKKEFSNIRPVSSAEDDKHEKSGFFTEEDDEKISLTGDELDNILGAAEEPAQEEAAAGDDDDDEAIALTGDELDNILNSADFTEESGTNETVESDFSLDDEPEAPKDETEETPPDEDTDLGADFSAAGADDDLGADLAQEDEEVSPDTGLASLVSDDDLGSVLAPEDEDIDLGADDDLGADLAQEDEEVSPDTGLASLVSDDDLGSVLAPEDEDIDLGADDDLGADLAQEDEEVSPDTGLASLVPDDDIGSGLAPEDEDIDLDANDDLGADFAAAGADDDLGADLAQEDEEVSPNTGLASLVPDDDIGSGLAPEDEDIDLDADFAAADENTGIPAEESEDASGDLTADLSLTDDDVSMDSEIPEDSMPTETETAAAGDEFIDIDTDDLNIDLDPDTLLNEQNDAEEDPLSGATDDLAGEEAAGTETSEEAFDGLDADLSGMDMSDDIFGDSEKHDSPELEQLRSEGVMPVTSAPENISYLENEEDAQPDSLDLSNAVIDEPVLTADGFNDDLEEPSLNDSEFDIDSLDDLTIGDSQIESDIPEEEPVSSQGAFDDIDIPAENDVFTQEQPADDDDLAFDEDTVIPEGFESEIEESPVPLDDDFNDVLDIPGMADDDDFSAPAPAPKAAAPAPQPAPAPKAAPAPQPAPAPKAAPAPQPAPAPAAPQAAAQEAAEEEAPSILATGPQIRAVGKDGIQIPSELKRELRSILSYMDQLLESLPEDKIEEFAKSQYFDSYKKLFKELGLV